MLNTTGFLPFVPSALRFDAQYPKDEAEVAAAAAEAAAKEEAEKKAAAAYAKAQRAKEEEEERLRRAANPLLEGEKSEMALYQRLLKENRVANEAAAMQLDSSKRVRAGRRRRKRHHRGLGFEWRQTRGAVEAAFKPGELVCVKVRRRKRWEEPVKLPVPAPCKVSRVNSNGTVDVAYLDAPYERENGLKRHFVLRVGESGFVDYWNIKGQFRPSPDDPLSFGASSTTSSESAAGAALSRAASRLGRSRSKAAKEERASGMTMAEMHDLVSTTPYLLVRQVVNTHTRLTVRVVGRTHRWRVIVLPASGCTLSQRVCEHGGWRRRREYLMKEETPSS